MFPALEKKRASDQVADAIRRRILSRQLGPGERLPGERELAAQFEVNRSTVREGLTALSQLGLVSVRHGGGAVVLDYRSRSGLQVLPYLLSSTTVPLLESLMEARRLLMVEIARLAARRASRKHLAALQGKLRELERAGDDVATFQDLDFELASLLAESCDNLVFLLIINSVRPVYWRLRENFRELYAERRRILSRYRALIAAIASRRERQAATAMDAAMRLGEESMGRRPKQRSTLGRLRPVGRPRPRQARTNRQRSARG